jgi:hypothetical protein
MGPFASLIGGPMGPLALAIGGAFWVLGARLPESGPPAKTLVQPFGTGSIEEANFNSELGRQPGKEQLLALLTATKRPQAPRCSKLLAGLLGRPPPY